MVTERVAIWDFFILYSGETFCDFVKKCITNLKKLHIVWKKFIKPKNFIHSHKK